MQLYLIDINVSAEIDVYPSLRFQDIRKKQNKVSRTDGCENSIPSPQTAFLYFCLFVTYPSSAFLNDTF